MKSRMLVIITLLVLIIGLGGAAAWWKLMGPGSGAVVQGVEATAEPTAVAEEAAVTEEAPTAEPTPSPEPEETEESSTMQGCITIRVLNARIGPGKEFPAAGGLGKGECVSFDARSADNQWLRVYGRVAERGDRLWASVYYINLEGNLNDLPIAE